MNLNMLAKWKDGIGKSGIVLLLLFLTVFITACSNDRDAKEETVSGEIDYDNLSGEIEVWGWNVAAEAMSEAADKFMEQHPDTTVKVKDMGQQDILDRLTVGLGSGGSGLPDITMLQSEQIAGVVAENPDQFLNLSEWGFDEYEDKFSDFKKDVVKNDDGEFIAFPWDIGPVAMYYRVDYFEEAGIDPDEIKTWDDYIKAGVEIKEKLDINMLPIEITYNDAVYRIMQNQLDVAYYNKDGEINIESEESKQAFETIKKMYDSDIVANVNDWDAQVAVIVNGEVASIPSGVWYVGTIMDQAKDSEGKWDVFELPAFEEGGNRAANYGGSDLAIPSSTDNPELAYAFAEFFTTDKETQLESFENEGLFPSLNTTHEDPLFDEEMEFFNNSPINRKFADISEEVNPRITTKDQSRTKDIMIDAQTSMLLEGKDVETALQEAAERIANETGRKQAKE